MTPCQLWQGRVDRDGYGKTGKHEARAHRVAWERVHGPIPDGMLVLHHCDNPPCINVEHLFLGTHADNVRDRHSKGRSKGPKGEAHGRAKLTADQVLAIRASTDRQDVIANQYGVTPATISKIKTRQTWQHI